jgi:hypothetical protein
MLNQKIVMELVVILYLIDLEFQADKDRKKNRKQCSQCT